MRISDWSSDVCSSDLLAGKLVDDAQLQDDVVVDAHALAVRQRLGPVLQPGIVRELPTQQVGEAGTQGAVHVLLVRRARLPEARPEGHCPLVSRLSHQMPTETGSGSEFVVEATEAVILIARQAVGKVAVVQVVLRLVLSLEGLLLGLDRKSVWWGK